MAMTTNPSTLLGCGRDIDAVWSGLGRPPSEHERTCPHCRAAREDLLPLAGATEELRTRDADDPALLPSPGLTDRILGLARSEVRRGRRIPLDPPGPDRTSAATVSTQAVAAVIRRVGDRTDDVQVRRVQLEPRNDADDPHAVPGRDGGAKLSITLRVSVAAHADIVAAADRLRHETIATVADEVGLEVIAVDVLVEDLHD